MSQPPTPTPLSPTDQDALVKQIGLALMRSAPEGWQKIKAEFRATGRYYELSAEVQGDDGAEQVWTASHEIAMHFARLRAGMYRDGRGTWFNARYHIERPSSYNLEFDRLEPQWRTPPPPPAFRDELHFFPRAEENVPEWLLRKLAGLPPERPGPRFRVARIFDGTAPNGRPSVNRPPVPDDERENLLAYLDEAPLVLPERGHDIDRLSQDGRTTVPVAFHTDGVWVWPAAVNYYLRRYGVPPEPDLVGHARAAGFRVPEVDEATKAAAANTITGGRPPGPPRPPAGPGVPSPRPTPPGPPAEAAMPAPPPQQPSMPPAPAPKPPMHRGADPVLELLGQRIDDFGIPENSYRIGGSAPYGWYLEQAEDGWQVGRQDGDFGAPMLFDDAADASAFLLGKLLLGTPEGVGTVEEPSRRSRRDRLDPVEEDVRSGPGAPVGLFRPADEPPAMAGPRPIEMDNDGGPPTELGAPLLFDEEEDNQPSGYVPPEPPILTPRAAESPVSVPLRGMEPPIGGSRPMEPAAVRIRTMEPSAAPTRTVEPASAAAPPPPSVEWPIQPMRGEPPLTLFRGKRMLELAPGTEIDRFGGPDGNLTYVFGTPFEQRSLVPEWIHRPYHVYQVRRPVQVLAGNAIPWFNQPGGGGAYLLPQAVEDLLRAGDLVEVDAGRPPI